MAVPHIFNVQRFSTSDGPGLRTTVFFKGCPLRCAWCHNPESQSFAPEPMPTPGSGIETVGQPWTIPELVAECLKDQVFYDQSGGGVTLSGGEVMVQDWPYLIELIDQLRQAGVSVGVDTCGVAAPARFRQLATTVDFWLYDLKMLDNAMHQRWTGGSNSLVKRNLLALSQLGATIYLRLILIESINTSDAAIASVIAWLRRHQITLQQVDLLVYHKLGEAKAARLGRPVEHFSAPSAARVTEIAQQFAEHYAVVTVGG
ncbi:MAG: radical SAM protein [Bifidobacteriaceae bacterium]|jgi:pyruvate formate lyase activating enzyme|nr:radical SAM protein [Bifidobacteriaceae bacterium]